jgi:hypothetical protein
MDLPFTIANTSTPSATLISVSNKIQTHHARMPLYDPTRPSPLYLPFLHPSISLYPTDPIPPSFFLVAVGESAGDADRGLCESATLTLPAPDGHHTKKGL